MKFPPRVCDSSLFSRLPGTQFPVSMMHSDHTIDQSMIINFEMKKIFGGEAKHNPRDSTQTPMYINLFAIFQQKLNILIKITSGPYRH